MIGPADPGVSGTGRANALPRLTRVKGMAKRKMTEVVVFPATAKLIEAAEDGDYHALGTLYGQAGALLAADGPLPEPLLSFMQARLFAIQRCLQKRDKGEYRDALIKAVAPTRRRGRPRKTPALLPYTVKEGKMVFLLERADGTFENRVAAVAEQFGVTRTAVVEARRKVEKARQLKPFQKSDYPQCVLLGSRLP
jgi:hypothetical protein